MTNCKTSFRLEIDGISYYYTNQTAACSEFKKHIADGSDVELWTLQYKYSQQLKRYVANQILLDYFSFRNCKRNYRA